MGKEVTPGTYIEVVIHRTVTQEKRVGVTVEAGQKNPDAHAKAVAMAKKEVQGDNGWHQIESTKPKVAELNDKGPIVYRKRRLRGRESMKSTGRPAA